MASVIRLRGISKLRESSMKNTSFRRIQSSKIQCFEITDFCEKEVIPMDLEIEQ